MHLLVRESRALDEDEAAVDLEQTPADLVFLSFSDSDLAAVAAAWQAERAGLPSLRLAGLAQLRHPMSVDLYVEQVAAHARTIVVRLLGGLDYWRYGCEQLAGLARERSIALALLPGDARDDPRLEALSTVPADRLHRLDRLFREGGPANVGAALRLAAHLAGRAADDGADAVAVPTCGDFAAAARGRGDRPLAVLVFYRAWLLAGDTLPVTALADALAEAGLDFRAIHVASLKEPAAAARVAAELARLRPAVLVNATGFSARVDGGASPLDAAGCPVLQVVLAGSTRAAWQESARGLSQTDLAMQVVLPELDGRLLAGAVSFKQPREDLPELEFRPLAHVPDDDLVRLVARRAAGWARLATASRPARRIALVLSDYPSAPGQVAHAVGLDGPASAAAILRLLAEAGYDVGDPPDTAALAGRLRAGTIRPLLSLGDYRRLSETLPAAFRDTVRAAWGAPESDPAVADGCFRLAVQRHGNVVLAVQPDRGDALDRKAAYHDPDTPPRHAYVAFHLWLSHVADVHALLHLGTHGTLEWLPGKAAALSGACGPAALAGGLPVVYPFIVNNPGEAAQAKRRLGAVTIGHLTPPLRSAGAHGPAAELERLIDEYAAADGLDRRRTGMLRAEILERADAAGLLAESGATRDAPAEDALARLDAYLCDVKDLAIRDGLHVFGTEPGRARRDALLASLSAGGGSEAVARALDRSAAAEREALLGALDGRFVEPGPAGAPSRGRVDVLPTGRNLYAVDPRMLPTRSAMLLAGKAADELLRRHLQEEGDWPRGVVVDLWGSAAMRTGGEDLALAFVLIGVEPVWDAGSGRVTGVAAVPPVRLDRPRIDVTLRISGLFRDAFPQQIALYDQAVRMLARLDEEVALNPFAAARGLDGEAFRRATVRVYGAPAGSYGTAVTSLLDRGGWAAAADLGAAHVAASAGAFGLGLDGRSDPAGLSARLATADALVHSQDHAEIDLLDGPEDAAHRGGLAAAARALGAAPALWRLDTSRPDAPKVRALAEEVARVVRGRAANPAWLDGMLRHGYRGAGEIARALDGLYGFAATLPDRFDPQFDLLYDATLGDARIDAFLNEHNPAARDAMRRRFAEAMARGLWQPRRNAVAADLADARP